MTQPEKLNIVERISQLGISPKPRWHFMLKDGVLWFLAVLATALGGLAVATSIFILTDHDWDVFRYLDRSFLMHVLVSLPYLWVVLLFLLLLLARFNFSQTRHGYRRETWQVVMASVLGSLALGLMLVAFGFDSSIHNLLLKQMPLYGRLVYNKDDIWIFPDKGLLNGFILDTADGRGFGLRDQAGGDWRILMDENTDLCRGPHIWPGEHVKLIGHVLQPHVFDAESVRPWGE
jgi:hypothetical protein